MKGILEAASRWGKHDLVRQGTRMVGWQALTKLCGVAATAWLARCLGPEKLGVSGMVMATAAQLALAGALLSDSVLTRRMKRLAAPEARSLVAGVFTVRLLFSLALAAGGVAYAGAAGLSREWWLSIGCGAVLFLLGFNGPFWVLQAEENVPANSRATALGSLASSALAFAFARPGFPAGADLVFLLAGAVVSFFLGWRAAWGSGWLPPLAWREVSHVWSSVREGGWFFATALVTYFYAFVDLPLVGWLVSLPEFGKYRTAVLLAGGLQQFLGIVPVLLYPRFIAWHQEGGDLLWRRQKRIAALLAAAVLPCVVLLFCFVRPAYRLLYGPAFADAAYPFALLFTSWLAVLLNGIFAWGLWAMHREKEFFLLVMLPIAVVGFGLDLWLIPRFGMTAAAAINLANQLLVLAGAFWLCARLRKRDGPGKSGGSRCAP